MREPQNLMTLPKIKNLMEYKIFNTKMKKLYLESRNMTIFGNGSCQIKSNSIFIAIASRILVENQQKLYFVTALVMSFRYAQILHD